MLRCLSEIPRPLLGGIDGARKDSSGSVPAGYLPIQGEGLGREVRGRDALKSVAGRLTCVVSV